MILVLISSLIFLMSCSELSAWNDEGHLIIVEVAKMLLQPDEILVLGEILMKTNSATSIFDVLSHAAIWPTRLKLNHKIGNLRVDDLPLYEDFHDIKNVYNPQDMELPGLYRYYPLPGTGALHMLNELFDSTFVTALMKSRSGRLNWVYHDFKRQATDIMHQKNSRTRRSSSLANQISIQGKLYDHRVEKFKRLHGLLYKDETEKSPAFLYRGNRSCSQNINIKPDPDLIQIDITNTSESESSGSDEPSTTNRNLRRSEQMHWKQKLLLRSSAECVKKSENCLDQKTPSKSKYSESGSLIQSNNQNQKKIAEKLSNPNKSIGISDFTQDSIALRLRLLLHVFGDIHQPLHVITLFKPGYPHGDDGGRLVPTTNPDFHTLHKFWDGCAGFCNLTLYGVRPISVLNKAEHVAKFCSIHSANAVRSFERVVQSIKLHTTNIVYTKQFGNTIDTTFLITSDYKESVLETSKILLCLAGKRLSYILKDIARALIKAQK